MNSDTFSNNNDNPFSQDGFSSSIESYYEEEEPKDRVSKLHLISLLLQKEKQMRNKFESFMLNPQTGGYFF
jgi:hypothetical protein